MKGTADTQWIDQSANAFLLPIKWQYALMSTTLLYIYIYIYYCSLSALAWF